MSFHDLPRVNASLNATSAILLVVGFILIKRRHVRAHATVMLCAVGTSAIFLACYVTYHIYRVRQGIGVTRFPVGRWQRPYQLILFTHTVLAVVILPLIFATLWFAYTRQWKRHHKIGMVTFPLWLYVSVTGVVVYWMLYHLAPTLAG